METMKVIGVRSIAWALGIAVTTGVGAPTVRAQEDAPEATDQESRGHPILLYIPNRIFDLLDIVRYRVRIGPGIAVGVRATEAVDVNLGAYTSIFLGLPGPRNHPRLNLPLGVETYTGVEISVVGGDDENDPEGPNYGALELGAGFQALLVGIDFGLDPGEAVDFALGLLFIDFIGDDL